MTPALLSARDKLAVSLAFQRVKRAEAAQMALTAPLVETWDALIDRTRREIADIDTMIAAAGIVDLRHAMGDAR